jgi:hypothetical protein
LRAVIICRLAFAINTKPYMPPKSAQKYMAYWLVILHAKLLRRVRLKHVRDIEPFLPAPRLPTCIWMDSYELTSTG